ncbi:hypothetical protein F4803DRAFT_553624 [Xylaria telfairii]|nr:hypothetical protein F4803DRAFT_553624 [Xylaria telfairii]
MSHRLDAAVLEWRVLAAVQPLFAAPVPWDLETHIDTADADVAGTANAITIDTAKEVFANEMGEMRINLIDLSGFDLEQQSFESCRYKMKHLLLLLETLVLEQVLHDPDAREGEQSLAAEQDDSHRLYQSISFTQVVKKRVWSWLAFESPVLESEQTSTTVYMRPKTSTTDIVRQIQPYEKLEALGRIVAKRSDQIKPLVEYCKVFINLQLSLESFKCLKTKAMKVNRVVDGLPQRMGMANLSAPRVQKLPRTNWESRKATELSDRLYQLLGKAICNGSRMHTAELQLDGFKLDESCIKNSLVQDILVSCPIGNGRHECRCISIMPNSTVAPDAILSDFCGSIRLFRPRPFNIHFDEDDLWYNKSHPETPAHNNNSGMLTLGNLLDYGFFGNDRDGDIFSLNDKAVLALSLARSLVHLWHGLWTRCQWTAESIQFPHTTNEILNRHRPFVTCTLTKSTESPMKPTADELQLSVLGFAQLLAEIETGKRIHLDHSFTSVEDFKDGIEIAMESRKNEFGRRDYNNAVQKCLQFMALLRRESVDRKEDLLTVARNVLYTNIIEPLEKNFNQIPDPVAAMMSCPLKIQGHSASDELITSVPQVTSENTLTAMSTRRDTRRQGDSTIPFDYRGTWMSKRDNTGVLFFDGKSTARQEHIDRAKIFFCAFEKFRKRHIIPKINEGRDGRRRIRIAILDTGIDQGNGDIRGLVDGINDSRKKQKLPRMDWNPIKGIKSFTGDDGVDEFGHGTHVAGLVLQTAPDADLYIAKVSCDKEFTDTGAIAQAIYWAIENEVDIISMSFGCEFDDHQVENALDCALNSQGKKAILLAAASNNGRNRKRTFPARHEGVIAIHSLDGMGNDEGGMNPSRHGYFENFGTLGLGIETSWDEMPPELGSSPNTPSNTATTNVYKSGSSYATPIAAGIIANSIEWMDYMKAKGQLNRQQYNSLRKPKGIRLMLKKQSEAVGDMLSVAPWILWKEDPLDPVIEGEAPRKVDEQADNHVLELLLEDLHPVKRDNR